ncbi:hypothetical protein BpHYR1_025679 [Brachionus plicatilis]|uniref:Uncharacterized protein n=1 Tax=Brachionus plicatilis TaxID=10195 RepID=A0A3M7SGP1_BRAPC|nr:hypothetical protein BpHYR1_025679 [Brachionus plicatilis]
MNTDSVFGSFNENTLYLPGDCNFSEEDKDFTAIEDTNSRLFSQKSFSSDIQKINDSKTKLNKPYLFYSSIKIFNLQKFKIETL